MLTVNFNSLLIPVKLIAQLLYRAISSAEFYRDVRDRYSGYGIRYITVITFLGAMLYLLPVMNMFESLNDYFNKEDYKGNYIGKTMDAILDQWPNIFYKNGEISMERDSPYVITDLQNKNLITIDSTNQNNNYSSYVILTKYYIHINLDNNDSKTHKKIPYSKVLGDQATIIDKHFIYMLLKNQFTSNFSLSGIVFLAIVLLPLITIYLLVLLVLKSVMVSIFVILLFNFSIVQSLYPIKSIIRLSTFCSAPTILMSIVISITNNNYLWVSFGMQLWVWILVAYSFHKFRGKNAV